MSRRLLFVLGFLAIAMVAEVGARTVLANRPHEIRWYDASTQRKVEQMERIGSADVLYAGTSMAWQAFVPDVVAARSGLQGYNAGLAGGTPEVMERWLVEEAVPRTRPDVVVWGLSSFDLAPAYGMSQRETYDDALATRPGALARVEQIAAERSVLVANRTILRSVSATFGEEAEERATRFARADRHLGPDGERLDFRIDVGPERRQVVEARLRDFAPDPADLDRIRRTVRALRSDGVDVVLVELPVPPRFVEIHPNGVSGHGQVAESLAGLAAELGVRFLRAPEGFDDADFVDFTHLGPVAAENFSRHFVDSYLAGIDHSGSAATASTGVTPPPPVSRVDPKPADRPADDCELVTVEDEYGFEIEVLRCEDESGEEAPPGPESTEAEGPRADTQPVTDRFVFHSGCDGGGADVGEIVEVLEPARADHLRRAMELMSDAETVCGTPEFPALFSVAVSELELAAGIDREPVDPQSVAETASRAIAADEVLRFELGGRSVTRSSGVWFHADEAAARWWLEQRERAGDPPRVVAIGDSTTNYGLSQAILDDAHDGSFLNLAVAGGDPEEWVTIRRRLFEGLTPPEHVIWPLTTHRLLDPPGRRCASLTGPHLRTTIRHRRQMLPQLRDGMTVPEMIMGPSLDRSPFLSSPAALAIADRYHAPGDRIVPEGTFVGMPAGQTRYPGAQFCAERMTDISRVLGDLQASGSEVTVVLLPLHPEVLAASDLHDDAREALISTVTAAGARYIELEGDYRDGETFDGWHANEVGQRRVSHQLVELLAG